MDLRCSQRSLANDAWNGNYEYGSRGGKRTEMRVGAIAEKAVTHLYFCAKKRP